MRLVLPRFVPPRLRDKLRAAGLYSVQQVHRRIRQGTLRELPGIGPKTEAEIIRIYTLEENRDES